MKALSQTQGNGTRHDGRGGDQKSVSRDTTLNLPSLGITRDQSSKWQRLAEVPQEPHFLFSREPHYRAVGCWA